MIDSEQIQAIADYVEQNGLSEALVSELRNQYSDCHFTYCMDDDIHFATAFLQRDSFNIYLVDSRQHCSTLTADADVASGVVLAEVVE